MNYSSILLGGIMILWLGGIMILWNRQGAIGMPFLSVPLG